MAARPTVHIPAPSADRPSWLRVGLVALVGFALGVAWPRIAGVRLGPAAPAEAVSAVAAQRAAEAASAAAASASVAPPPAPSASAAPAPVITINVGHAAILSCKNDDGDTLKGRECGGLAGLDPLVQTRLKRLSQAPAAATNPGKLNIVLGLDFKNNHISVESGRSSTVKDVASLKAFVAGEVKSMSLKSVDHQYDRYSVVYVVHIQNGEEKSAEPAPAATASATPSAASSQAALPEGEAAVAWDTAIVRDAPHTGTIVARLPRGTHVQLGASQGGWYKIKYGAGFASDGYVYRGAIGK
ncbi:MAG TPA: SH3 domain-containing protein [Polyangiaceae bacterium]|jgi:hypothetical protein